MNGAAHLEGELYEEPPPDDADNNEFHFAECDPSKRFGRVGTPGRGRAARVHTRLPRSLAAALTGTWGPGTRLGRAVGQPRRPGAPLTAGRVRR